VTFWSATQRHPRTFGEVLQTLRRRQIVAGTDRRKDSRLHFDIDEGVTYELGISKPIGQRIQNLRFRGQQLSPTRKLRLATNNYRVNGGGGYTMYKDAPDRISIERRDSRNDHRLGRAQQNRSH
jgi:hypothetical protein